MVLIFSEYDQNIIKMGSFRSFARKAKGKFGDHLWEGIHFCKLSKIYITSSEGYWARQPLNKNHPLNKSIGFCVCYVCLKSLCSLPELNSVISSETWRVDGVGRAVGIESAGSPFSVSLALGLLACNNLDLFFPWPCYGAREANSASSSCCCWLLLGEKSLKVLYKLVNIPRLEEKGFFWHIKVNFYKFK